MNLKSFVKKFLAEEAAVTAVEYAIMLACIVLIAFQAMLLCGVEVKAFFEFNADEIGDKLNN